MCEAFFELNFVKEKLEDCRKEGISQGIVQGISQGIKSLIEVCQELGLSANETSIRLKDKFSITDESANAYLAQYWK